MGQPAPIPRRSSHLGSAACYGRSAHGSHSSTSAASSRSKRRQGNHNQFQTLKMFPDGHLEVVARMSRLNTTFQTLGSPVQHRPETHIIDAGGPKRLGDARIITETMTAVQTGVTLCSA